MRGTSDNQSMETYVEDAIAALDLAGVALAVGVFTAGMRTPFHARAGGDGGGDGEQGRDAREHGQGEEEVVGLGIYLSVGEGVFMLSVVTRLGKEMIRDSMTRTYIHAIGHFEVTYSVC